MTFPSVEPHRWAFGRLSDTPPGHIAFRVQRGRHGEAMLGFGEDGRTTHLLYCAHPNGLVSAVAATDLTALYALWLNPSGRFRLSIGTQADPARQVGCVAPTEAGMVVCAAAGLDAFRELIPAYFNLSTGASTVMTPAASTQATWFSDWSLAYLYPENRPTRILGSPDPMIAPH